MKSAEAREAAWFAVHDALPAQWAVGPVTYDPGIPGWYVEGAEAWTQENVGRGMTGHELERVLRRFVGR